MEKGADGEARWKKKARGKAECIEGWRKRERTGKAQLRKGGRSGESEIRSETPVAEGQRKRPIVFPPFPFFFSPAAAKG